MNWNWFVNRDKIKITVKERSWEEPEEVWNEEQQDFQETGKTVTKYDIDTTIEINGKETKHYTDLYAIFDEVVYKSEISNYDDWYGDTYKESELEYIPITKSWHYNQSRFYPFTCSCGNAGCASIWNGIHTKWRKYSVEYRIKDKRDGYENILDKMFYSFDRKQYEKEVLTVWGTLCKLVEHNPENESEWIVRQIKELNGFKNSILNTK